MAEGERPTEADASRADAEAEAAGEELIDVNKRYEVDARLKATKEAALKELLDKPPCPPPGNNQTGQVPGGCPSAGLFAANWPGGGDCEDQGRQRWYRSREDHDNGHHKN